MSIFEISYHRYHRLRKIEHFFSLGRKFGAHFIYKQMTRNNIVCRSGT